jgi:hypothetical protein
MTMKTERFEHGGFFWRFQLYKDYATQCLVAEIHCLDGYSDVTENAAPAAWLSALRSFNLVQIDTEQSGATFKARVRYGEKYEHWF